MTIWPRFEPNNDLEARPLELMGSREKGTPVPASHRTGKFLVRMPRCILPNTSNAHDFKLVSK
jgi:hypothetical protein